MLSMELKSPITGRMRTGTNQQSFVHNMLLLLTHPRMSADRKQ